MSSCPICSSLYERSYSIPRNLPCGHVFCENCIYEVCLRNQEFKCQSCFIIFSQQEIQKLSSPCYGLLDLLDEILYKFDNNVNAYQLQRSYREAIDLKKTQGVSLGSFYTNRFASNLNTTTTNSSPFPDEKFMPKYFTPPDKTTLQRPISPFHNMTPNPKFNYTVPRLSVDPQEKCVVEGCLGRRIYAPNGEKMLVCSVECDKKLRGIHQFY